MKSVVDVCVQMIHLAVLVLFAIGTTCPTAAGNDRPNIILCMGDDHGWNEVGYNGHPHVRTPVLDEMAATGLRLDRFYSAHPSCSPTRGSVITGRHPNRYGTFAPNWSIRPQEISIAQILANAGYACGHFGKWHLGPVKKGSPTSPGAMGFHTWLSHDNFFEMNPVLSRNGVKPERIVGEGSEVIIDETVRFIEQASKDGKPFFAVVWFGSPHEPYSGLKEDLALYDDLPAEYAKTTVTLTSNESGRPVKRPLREVLRERYAEITAMDRAVGKLREHLQESGKRKDTILWYCGDNGVPRSGNAAMTVRGLKGQMYEGGVRVPGLIEWPGRISNPHASAVNAVTSDTLPTLCDLLGLPLPNRPLDGVSLKPLIDGKMKQRPRPICFWSYNTGRLGKKKQKPWIDPQLQEGTTPLVKMLAGRFTRNFVNVHHPSVTEKDYAGARAILGNQYKLVIHDGATKEPVKELFDIRADPAEQDNLAEAQPELCEKFEKELRDWQASVLRSVRGADYEQ